MAGGPDFPTWGPFNFSKVPMINGLGKLFPFTLKIEVSIKLSVNETKWSSSLARTRALIFYILI